VFWTGVVVTPEVINGVETVHVMVPRLEDHWPADPQWHSLRSREAGLVDAIAALPAGDCRRLAAWAAGEAGVSSGLDGIPAIAQSVAALAAAAEPLPSDTEVLLRRIIADGYRKRDEGPWLPSSPGVAMVREVGPLARQGGRRAAAAKALWGAANPDPVGAALDAIDSARFAYPHDGPDFLDQVRRKLS
jgi:hypothetical protein